MALRSGMSIKRCRGRWREELPGSPLRWLLLPGWLVLRPLIALRNWCFDFGWRPIYRLPVLVWSVGNITAGGTGKTPLTRYLARWANNHGLQPTIVARGYGAVPGKNDNRNDEAMTIAECPVICNPDRVAGGNTALHNGATCLILDDGFQHRRLARQLDIVVIDATKPFGGKIDDHGAVLPLGYLREPHHALRRAQLIALTRSNLITEQELTSLRNYLLRFGKPIVRVVDTAVHLTSVLGGDDHISIETLRQQPVILVSGLGNPLGFERSAENYGWIVHESLRYPDHYHYTPDDLTDILQRAEHHHATIVMTGKDAVKIRALISPAHAARMRVLHTTSDIAPEDAPTLDGLLRDSMAQFSPKGV
jgi:tetraacyldisaccharide 4'-kinase